MLLSAVKGYGFRNYPAAPICFVISLLLYKLVQEQASFSHMEHR